MGLGRITSVRQGTRERISTVPLLERFTGITGCMNRLEAGDLSTGMNDVI